MVSKDAGFCEVCSGAINLTVYGWVHESEDKKSAPHMAKGPKPIVNSKPESTQKLFNRLTRT